MSSSKKVVIVGAGLAGLTAALELRSAGFDVTVLESRTRAGGRVLTLREPFPDGLYAEVGAARVGEDHDLTRAYAARFGLEVDPFLQLNGSPVYHVRGRRIAIKPGEPVEWPLDLTPEERRLGIPGMMDKYVLSVIREAGATAVEEWPPAALMKYDAVTFTELLRQRGASPAAVTLLGMGYFNLWGDGADTYSALLMLRQTTLTPKQTFAIRGGNDLLPKALARELRDAISYGAQVVRIEQDADAARVVFLQGGVQQTVSAARVLCTLPFSVLRAVEISPPLSPGKRRAVAELPYISVTRVFIQSRDRFWVAEGLDGFAVTDLPILNTGHVTFTQRGTRGILESFTTGPRAREMSALPEAERLRFTLEHMEKVYPGLRRRVEGGNSYAWDDDEWSRGATVWFRPGQMAELLPHVATPEGRVHFAGEHTSAFPGTMQGAIASGLRAAREIGAT